MICLIVVVYFLVSGCGPQTQEILPTPSPTPVESTATPSKPSLLFAGFPADGLLAYYPFDGNAQDFSGNDNHGILSGASQVSDRFGEEGAVSFDGVDDYFIVNSTLLSAIKSDMTISMWVNTAVNEFSHLLVISNEQGLSENTAYINFIWQGDWLGFGYSLGRGDLITYLQDDIYDDSWHHLVGVIQNGMLKFYVDGIQNSFKMGTASFTDLQYIIIGNWLGTDGHEFPSVVIDDLAIYDRAISENKILVLYSFGS
jgi:hypothetical protein